MGVLFLVSLSYYIQYTMGHISVYMRYLVPSRCGCVGGAYTTREGGDETRGHRRKMRLALADVISATV